MHLTRCLVQVNVLHAAGGLLTNTQNANIQHRKPTRMNHFKQEDHKLAEAVVRKGNKDSNPLFVQKKSASANGKPKLITKIEMLGRPFLASVTFVVLLDPLPPLDFQFFKTHQRPVFLNHVQTAKPHSQI